MWMQRAWGGVLVLAIGAALAGCGSGGGKACTAGAEGCACLPANGCLLGLTCASQLCVNLGGGGAGGQAGTAGEAGMTGAGSPGTAGAGAVGGPSGAGGFAGNGGSSGTGGAAGAKGVAGAPGTGGAAGVVGATGTAGTGGAGGTAGTAGTSGTAGTTGTAGTSGTAGTTGTGGTSGAAGTTGAAGTSGAAGATGSGGTGTGGCGDLIDNFEASGGYICQDNGRVGSWFSYHDTASTLSPTGTPTLPSLLPTPRGTSLHALHFYGTEVEYAGVGCSINNVPTATYNASAFTGIRFYIMGTAVAPVAIVQTRQTESTSYGGQCALATLSCAANDLAITGLQASAWTLVTVPFSSLSGGTAPFDVTSVWSIEFQPGIGAFDLWIDDLTFY